MLREVISGQHPLVKHLVKLRHNRDYRYEHHSLIIEGIKPIQEICRHASFKTLVAADESLLPKGLKANEVLIVSENVIRKVSSMQSPEGLIAEIEMPKPSSLLGLKYILVLDGVSDPGNVGTLLRSALALGWEGAYIIEESCDPFNEKALRAARGATFRLPLAWGNWEDLKKIMRENEIKPIVADLKGISLREVSANQGILLVMGNEAHGASEEAKQLCQPATIAMVGDMESLNVSVAGGIMMYELRKTNEF